MTSHRIQRALLLVASILLLGAGLGSIDFWAPDEPRYGQVAEEVRSLEHGAAGVLLLHLGGEPYTQKPPLYYWLAALAGAAGGGRVSETAARLPSMLAGVATVLLTYTLGLRLFASPRAALFAAALLLTTFRFAHTARRAQLDVLLALCETAALALFWRIDADARAGRPPARGLVLAVHAALGAAALTKGPVGWLPLLAFVAYLAWERRLHLLREILPWWSPFVFAGPVIAWVTGATLLAPSGFFDAAVVDNLVGRVVEAESHVRPIYYFLYQLPADFLPWTLAWPFALAAALAARRKSLEVRRPWRLLAAWVAVPLLVFSLSSGKRGLYLLPVFPALALGCGAGLDAWLAGRERLPVWLRAPLALAGGVAVAFGIATLGRGHLEAEHFPGFAVSDGAAAALLLTGGLGLLLAAAPWRTRTPTPALAAIVAAVWAVEALIFTVVYPGFDEEKSPRTIARLAAGLTAPGETVGIFDDAGLAGGILYYGERPAAILPRPPQVQHFLDGGGRFVILERWKLPWLEPVGPLHVHGTTRRERRELAIVSPHPPHPLRADEGAREGEEEPE